MLPRPLARRPAAQVWRPNNWAAMNLPGLRDQTARPEKIHGAAQVLPSARTSGNARPSSAKSNDNTQSSLATSSFAASMASPSVMRKLGSWSRCDKSLISQLGQQCFQFFGGLGVFNLEFRNQMLHDLLHIEPLAEQFPNPRSGLVKFKNAAGRNINENRGLVQALGDNLRIGAQHKIESKFAQRYHLQKGFPEMTALPKTTVNGSICSEQTSIVI